MDRCTWALKSNAFHTQMTFLIDKPSGWSHLLDEIFCSPSFVHWDTEATGKTVCGIILRDGPGDLEHPTLLQENLIP